MFFPVPHDTSEPHEIGFPYQHPVSQEINHLILSLDEINNPLN
ncbi:hypothetical protein CIT292_09478 [Citrobacter youngae ATCC 29220]|uniref:Uncharacterized protein n=1 Tax=Citrobacter youngae ATCC 29220 TaxID=500640 RepID=D4BFB1_9ENTR|nr:hypothetical protein CIT292_09478 [Citrobacter youngae ATCC 29220]